MAKHFAGERAVSCRVTLFLCVLLALTAFARPPDQCARFSFPTISSNKIIRVAEGLTLTLPFKLDISHCPRSSNQNVYVYVSTPRRHDFCAVRLTSTGCTSTSNEKCACVDDTSAEKGAVLAKTVTKADRGPWVWRTGDGSVRTEITFEVLKPSDLPVTTVTRSSEKDSRRDDGLTTAVATAGLVHQPVMQETPLAPAAPRETDDTTEEDISLSHDRSDGEDEVQEHNILISGKSIGKGDNHAGGLAENLGGVISIVIVIAIVIIGVIVVVVFRKRRAQKEGKYPMPADVTGDDILLRQRQEPQNDAGNSYVPLCPIRHSGEETSEAFINDAYLASLPRQQRNSESKMLA